MSIQRTIPLIVVFYKTEGGNEPVREWLRSLEKSERRSIGEDIKTVQWGWPIGMPVVKKLDNRLWEIRTELDHKISRILFTLLENNIVLLHGFIKKSHRTPKKDLDLARERIRHLRGE